MSHFWFQKLKLILLRHFAVVVTLLGVGSVCLHAETLQEYSKACDDAIGSAAGVQAFECDLGTEVPDNHPTASANNGNCDEPNRLNRECDQGSRFQVLTRSDDAYVVAHCRKKGNQLGGYRDIAVIQYNRKNGATCFYQALGDNLPQNVPAPLGGEQGFWFSPAGTANIGCANCHDSGALIRSPYLNQVTGANRLPGSDPHIPADLNFNNANQPYAFVGQDFANWKTYNVFVAGNTCISCHTMGVSNVGTLGTARDLGLRATSQGINLDNNNLPVFELEDHKNAISSASPIWMPPAPPFQLQTAFNLNFAKDARAIHDCAQQFRTTGNLPNTDACRITLHAAAFVGGPAGGNAGVGAMAAILTYLNEPGTGTIVPQPESSGVPTGLTGAGALPAVTNYILN